VATAEGVDVQKGEGLVGLDELEGGNLAYPPFRRC
jgi:hypothetical protein